MDPLTEGVARVWDVGVRAVVNDCSQSVFQARTEELHMLLVTIDW